MSHVRWPSITNFHSLRRTLKEAPELLGDNAEVRYRAKIKLHGTNAGVRIMPDGQVLPLSRDRVIAPGKTDNMGFAAWVVSESAYWGNLGRWHRGEIVIFGEWCGPKIQNGMALNKIPAPIFAVFAVIDLTANAFIVEPEAIRKIVGEHPRVHVLPWFFDERAVEGFSIDWSMSAEELEQVVEPLNELVLRIEACDPWVKAIFGIEGMGEGLVFYPDRGGVEAFSTLAFKAKGKEHRMVAAVKPIQPNPEAAKNAPAFADLVVTPARLEQGVRETSEGQLAFSIGKLGAFLSWISRDVAKEAQAELEASGLAPKIAIGACIAHAKTWYMNQLQT